MAVSMPWQSLEVKFDEIANIEAFKSDFYFHLKFLF